MPLSDACFSMMPPGMWHYVLTTDTTIAYGAHFYSACHVVRTVSSLAHALFSEHYTTNTSHWALFRVLLRMLPAWWANVGCRDEQDQAGGRCSFCVCQSRAVAELFPGIPLDLGSKEDLLRSCPKVTKIPQKFICRPISRLPRRQGGQMHFRTRLLLITVAP